MEKSGLFGPIEHAVDDRQFKRPRSGKARQQLSWHSYDQFPQVGSQTPIWTHNDDANKSRRWQVAGPETVSEFSAVGYFFARHLHQTLGVPVGMINNAWGGSACEAWIDRPTLEKAGSFKELLASWDEQAQQYESLAAKKDMDEKAKETSCPDESSDGR